MLLLACIWGSSFILMKKGMFADDQSPIFSATQVGALRMLIASSALLPLSIVNLRKLKAKKDLLLFAVVGFCGNFFPAFLFTYAETGISSGFAGMMNSFTPIFTIVLGFLVFGHRLTAIQLSGAFIGSIGITCLILTGQNVSFSGDLKHILAVVLATFFYGISLNTIKYKLQQYTSAEITSLAFAVIFIPALLCFFILDTTSVFKNNVHASEGFSYIAMLALAGTAIATFLFNGILRISSALFASSVTYFIPIVAVIIGLWFKESISVYQVLSMIIILGGVLFANYGGRFFTKKVSE